MARMELTDLFPETGTFKLKSTGDHEHRLRPVNLIDRAWITRTFGEGNVLQAMFEKSDFASITKLVFYLLEDKSPFPAGEIDDLGENFEVVKRKVAGPERIMQAIVSPAEQIAVMKALLKTIGVSEPMLDAISQDLAAAGDAEKKRAASPRPTGKKFVTKSKASTATRTSSSAR